MVVRGELAKLREMMNGVREVEQMRRRQFLSLPLAALAVAPASLERIAASHSVDTSLVAAYDDVLNAAVGAYSGADMASYFATLHPYVVQMSDRLSAPMAADLRSRLAKVVGHTATLAARSALVVGNRGAADAMTALLHQTARNVNDSELVALAHYSRANLHSAVYFGNWQHSPVAVSNIDAALLALGPSAPHALRKVLLFRHALETSMAGGTRFLETVEAARAVPLEEGAGLYERGKFFAATPYGLHTEAVGRAVLGQTSAAQIALQRDLANTPRARVRARALVSADLAQVYIRAKEPEQAAAAATEALELAQSVNSNQEVQRVRYAAANMRQWDIPSVRLLRERLTAE